MNHAGYEHQLRAITSRWQPTLQRLCTGYEHSARAQEGLLRGILTAIWRNLPRDPEGVSARACVYRVAYNVAARRDARRDAQRDARRAARRAARHAARHAGKKRTPLPAGPPTQGHLPEEAARDQRRLDALRAAIRTLKPLDRQVAILALEEIPQDEIAEITGLAVSDIATRRQRIEERLADTKELTTFDELQDLWIRQKLEQRVVRVKTLKHRVARSVRKVVYRDIREWALALVLTPFFVWQAILMEMPLMRVANIELAVTCLYVSFRLYRNGAARRPGDETVETSAYLVVHRAAVLGQAAFLHRSRFWHLLPFAIGGVLLLAGILLELASIGAPMTLLGTVALVGVGVMALLWFVDWIHVRGGRKLGERAARLSDADSV